jgi:mono/diheme cytochrome c family protein
MREHDVLLCRANVEPEAHDDDKRLLVRRIVGRALLATSVLLIVAGLPGPHAIAASSADQAAGAEVFKQSGCEHCHGPDGIGTNRAPSLTTVGKRLKKDQIERQILAGGKQMPPFADVLTFDETHKLVDYLSHKKKATKLVPGAED